MQEQHLQQEAKLTRDADGNSMSSALIIPVPGADETDQSNGSSTKRTSTKCTSMICTSRYEGFIPRFMTQCCCLAPILMTDIALLFLGFQDVAYDVNEHEMCGSAMMDLDTFAKMAGLVGVAVFVLICVLDGVKGVMTRSTAETDDQTIVVDWFDFVAYILAIASVPKMVLAPMGMILYYSISTVCQSSDLGLVLAAWSLFNGMIAIIDFIGIIKNWNYLKLWESPFQREKEETNMPKEE